MKALIVGGTTGFGAALVTELSGVYDIVTVGRSEISRLNHYVCDVANVVLWQQVLRKICVDHPDIELVICVAGYARLQSRDTLTENDWQRTAVANTTYVKLVYRIMRQILAKQHGCFVVIGSRWSYYSDCDLLLPYITAKHRLLHWVNGIAARNAAIRFVHCVVPQMNTPQYWQVLSGLSDSDQLRRLFPLNPTSAQAVARCIATAVIEWRGSDEPVNFQIDESATLKPAEDDVP